MKQYPSISHIIRTDIPIYAFDKLDGSNIRAEWERKKGFWKFGSRRQLLSDETPILRKSVDLINEKYAEDLDKVFYKHKIAKAICFFEFWGPKSFAGLHEEDDDHTITLIDVNPYKKGILEPRLFIKYFGHLDIPKLVYHGKANQDFVKAIRWRSEGVTFEGVVCKAKYKNQIVMFKIKTRTWIMKVREFYADDQQKLGSLLEPEDLKDVGDFPGGTSYRERRFCLSCFKAGQLPPVCTCGGKTLELDYYAQAPRVKASKSRWRKFFQQWYPEEDFKQRWERRGKQN